MSVFPQSYLSLSLHLIQQNNILYIQHYSEYFTGGRQLRELLIVHGTKGSCLRGTTCLMDSIKNIVVCKVKHVTTIEIIIISHRKELKENCSYYYTLLNC